jgi:hypothetical protein
MEGNTDINVWNKQRTTDEAHSWGQLIWCACLPYVACRESCRLCLRIVPQRRGRWMCWHRWLFMVLEMWEGILGAWGRVLHVWCHLALLPWSQQLRKVAVEPRTPCWEVSLALIGGWHHEIMLCRIHAHGKVELRTLERLDFKKLVKWYWVLLGHGQSVWAVKNGRRRCVWC